MQRLINVIALTLVVGIIVLLLPSVLGGGICDDTSPGVCIRNWVKDVVIPLMAFAAASFAAAFALGQMRAANLGLHEARRSAEASELTARIARQELEMSQRPLLFMKHIDASVAEPHIRITVTLENSGPAPTINGTTRINWKAFERLPDLKFTYPDFGEPIDTSFFCGPKATVFSDILHVPLSVLEQVASGQIHILIWGWAEYEGPTATRYRTEFCNRVEVLRHGTAADGKRQLEVRFPQYGHFNRVT